MLLAILTLMVFRPSSSIGLEYRRLLSAAENYLICDFYSKRALPLSALPKTVRCRTLVSFKMLFITTEVLQPLARYRR